jgi:cytochrome c biogenesis protein CcmG/thiol:disulfide interchange protein DsbE
MHAILVRRKTMETPQASQTEEPRRRFSPALIATGAIALLVLGLLGYALIDQPGEPPQVGSQVPDFHLTSLDGNPMSMSTHQGEIVVLNFFASWCAPCRQEAAALEQTWRQYQDRGVQFVGIAYKDAASKAQAFLDEFAVTYPSAVEPGNHTAQAYGVTGVPETFVVDQQGRLVHHFVGPVTQAELSHILDQAVNP